MLYEYNWVSNLIDVYSRQDKAGLPSSRGRLNKMKQQMYCGKLRWSTNKLRYDRKKEEEEEYGAPYSKGAGEV